MNTQSTSSPEVELSLSDYELETLTSIMRNQFTGDSFAWYSAIEREVVTEGRFNTNALSLALIYLLKKDMILAHSVEGMNSTSITYSLSPKGTEWLLNNKSKIETVKTDEVPF